MEAKAEAVIVDSHHEVIHSMRLIVIWIIVHDIVDDGHEISFDLFGILILELFPSMVYEKCVGLRWIIHEDTLSTIFCRVLCPYEILSKQISAMQSNESMGEHQ